MTALQDYECQGLLSGGVPRLGVARSVFLGLRDLDFKGLVDYFKAWSQYPEYLVLQKRYGELFEKKKTIAVKCSKRGNDVYWWRVGKRLRAFKDQEDIRFFNVKDRGRKTTRAIFVTLTCDPKLGSVEDAWTDNGKLWNVYITNLRRKFGHIDYMRTFESFVSGYPHVHALMVFKDHEFRVMRMNGKNRVSEKAVFESGWSAYVDVQACSTLRNARLYITKYLTKEFHEESDEALDRSLRGLTLSMNWIFRKRSFAVSRGLVDLISTLHNSNSDNLQVDLNGVAVASEGSVRWVFGGVHGFEELKIDGKSWQYDLREDQFEVDWFKHHNKKVFDLVDELHPLSA